MTCDDNNNNKKTAKSNDRVVVAVRHGRPPKANVVAASAKSTTPTLHRIKWLAAVSAAFRDLVASGKGVNIATLAGRPVCSIDCSNGDLYNRVHAAWGVPWSAVARNAHFMKAWFAMCAARRRVRLLDTPAFARQLDADRWHEHMLQRDDADMLAALPAEVVKHEIRATYCVSLGAVRCLSEWARIHDWPCADWWTGRLSKVFWWDDAACGAAAVDSGSLAMVRLLRAHGCAVPPSDVDSDDADADCERDREREREEAECIRRERQQDRRWKALFVDYPEGTTFRDAVAYRRLCDRMVAYWDELEGYSAEIAADEADANRAQMELYLRKTLRITLK